MNCLLPPALIKEEPPAPAFIRVRVFEYRDATAQERRETGQWWWRNELGVLVAPYGGQGVA
ncbi:MAG: hypothetical protein L0J06_13445 [Yaniella sp.]|nr:hypothetical protein [Yaniella sp.]